MPQPLTNAVLTVLAQRPDGMTSQEIREALPSTVGERTLQRWLVQLREDGKVIAGRSGREIRYLLAVVPQVAETTEGRPPEGVPAVESGTSALPSDGGAAVVPLIFPRKPEGGPASAAEVAELFAESVPQILGGLMPRVSAIAFLQVAARIRRWPPDATKRLVEYGKTRLATLTPAEAEACGVDPELCAKWRKQYFRQSAAPSPDGSGDVA